MAEDSELERLKTELENATERLHLAAEERQRAWDRLDPLREALDETYKEQQKAYRTQAASGKAYAILRAESDPKIKEIEAQYKREHDLADAVLKEVEFAQAHGDTETARRLMQKAEAHDNAARLLYRKRRPLIKALTTLQKAHFADARQYSVRRKEYKLARGRMNDAINVYKGTVAKRDRLARERDAAKRAYREAASAASVR